MGAGVAPEGWDGAPREGGCLACHGWQPPTRSYIGVNVTSDETMSCVNKSYGFPLNRATTGARGRALRRYITNDDRNGDLWVGSFRHGHVNSCSLFSRILCMITSFIIPGDWPLVRGIVRRSTELQLLGPFGGRFPDCFSTAIVGVTPTPSNRSPSTNTSSTANNNRPPPIRNAVAANTAPSVRVPMTSPSRYFYNP